LKVVPNDRIVLSRCELGYNQMPPKAHIRGGRFTGIFKDEADLELGTRNAGAWWLRA